MLPNGKTVKESGGQAKVLGFYVYPFEDDDAILLDSEAAGYYRTLATSNKSQEKFLNGWLNRAYRHMIA